MKNLKKKEESSLRSKKELKFKDLKQCVIGRKKTVGDNNNKINKENYFFISN